MIPEEITAIASEYAKEMAIKDRKEGFPESFIKSMLSVSEYNMESAIQFLERRYCLVEKNLIKKLFQVHKKESKGLIKGEKAWFSYNGRIELLKHLFPEIGKEVES